MKVADDVIVVMTCRFCGKEHVVRVNEKAFYEWQNGALIQNVMPELSATQREQLISEICPACQDNLFGKDPEEDEDEGDDISACMHESLEFTGQWW